MQRLLLPILVPLGALLATVTVVLSMGLLLLWVGDFKWNGSTVSPVDFFRLVLGDHPRTEIASSNPLWEAGKHSLDLGLFHMNAPVIVALLVATAILAGATLASRWGRSRR